MQLLLKTPGKKTVVLLPMLMPLMLICVRIRESIVKKVRKKERKLKTESIQVNCFVLLEDCGLETKDIVSTNLKPSFSFHSLITVDTKFHRAPLTPIEMKLRTQQLVSTCLNCKQSFQHFLLDFSQKKESSNSAACAIYLRLPNSGLGTAFEKCVFW